MSWGHPQHVLVPVMGTKCLRVRSWQYASVAHFTKPSGNWSCLRLEGKGFNFQKVSEFRLVQGCQLLCLEDREDEVLQRIPKQQGEQHPSHPSHRH